MTRMIRCLLVCTAVVIAPAAAQAQTGSCQANCRVGERAALGALSGLMLASGGGNPWLGSASTLGFRTVTFPRLGAQVRTGFTSLDVPGTSGDALEGVTPIALAAGLSMAILDGISPASTVGGLGSVDLFGNAGIVFLPEDAGFGGSPFAWSVGARIGIFRESFTLPGLTASVAYRGLGEINFDRAAVLARDAGFSWRSASAWQARGVVGKRLSAFSLAGGFGWDGASADATVFAQGPAGTVISDDIDLDSDRYQLFLDVTWTSLIVSVTGEAGWQFGPAGDDVLGDRDAAAGGRAFGALGVRLTF